MRAAPPVFTTQDSIADPEFARIAQRNLAQRLGRLSWYRGSKVISDGAGGHAIDVRVTDWGAAASVPRIWLGTPVVVKIVGEGRSLSGAQLSAQDYGNIAIGGMVLVGTFIVGKIAVESIIASRREHFDAQGQPPAAVAAKETTADGIVKVLVTGYSLYMMSQQLPELLGEVKKMAE